MVKLHLVAWLGLVVSRREAFQFAARTKPSSWPRVMRALDGSGDSASMDELLGEEGGNPHNVKGVVWGNGACPPIFQRRRSQNLCTTSCRLMANEQAITD